MPEVNAETLDSVGRIIQIGSQAVAVVFIAFAFYLLWGLIRKPPTPDPQGKKLQVLVGGIRTYIAFSLAFMIVGFVAQYFLRQVSHKSEIVMRPKRADLKREVRLPSVLAGTEPLHFNDAGQANWKIDRDTTFYIEANEMSQDFDSLLANCEQLQGATQVKIAQDSDESPFGVGVPQ